VDISKVNGETINKLKMLAATHMLRSCYACYTTVVSGHLPWMGPSSC